VLIIKAVIGFLEKKQNTQLKDKYQEVYPSEKIIPLTMKTNAI
jgi:hypothetical protein